jgi:hypothetical protein
MINWVYEQSHTLDDKLNFIECKENNPSGLSRFHPSVLAETTRHYDSKNYVICPTNIFSVKNRPDNYVIPVGVRHHPVDWTRGRGRSNLFDWISPIYLKDLQEGRALLLLDQGLEGYHISWLWEWFHEQFIKYSIPPKSVVYVTGNWNTGADYDSWANQNGITDKLKTIGYAHFEFAVMQIARDTQLFQDWNTNIEYKKNNEIKTFSCLQKRLRTHRIWFLGQMYKSNLIDKGLISTNDWGDMHVGMIDGRMPDNDLLQQARSILPLEIYGQSNTQFGDGYYIDRIYEQVYKDSWVSVVSEPIFNDEDRAVFISEKTFKSIACMHPFIILGGRHSLQALRDMGYRTFEGFIDERYDSMSSHDRMTAIINELKRIDSIENKLEWFMGMREILEHNYNHFHSRKDIRTLGSVELLNYCKDYFNVS